MTAVETVVGYAVCDYCGGNGCARCHGHGETAVYEWMAPDPTCARCGEQPQEDLTHGGLCQSCDYEDDLADGFLPSHSGGVRRGPA